MLGLLKAKTGANFLEEPAVVLDISQSIHMCRFRQDGLLPTLSTSSAMFVPKLGRCLATHELFFLMGFPVSELESQLRGFKPHVLRKLVGNTMHCDVVGYVLLAGLYVAAASEKQCSNQIAHCH